MQLLTTLTLTLLSLASVSAQNCRKAQRCSCLDTNTGVPDKALNSEVCKGYTGIEDSAGNVGNHQVMEENWGHADI